MESVGVAESGAGQPAMLAVGLLGAAASLGVAGVAQVVPGGVAVGRVAPSRDAVERGDGGSPTARAVAPAAAPAARRMRVVDGERAVHPEPVAQIGATYLSGGARPAAAVAPGSGGARRGRGPAGPARRAAS